MTAIPIYPLNDIAFTFVLKEISSTGSETGVTTGTVTAFLATSDLPGAEAADPSLSWACTFAGGSGKWLARLDGADLTVALMRSLFGTPQASFSDNFTRADAATLGGGYTVLGAADGAAWGIASNKAKLTTENANGLGVVYRALGTADLTLRTSLSVLSAAGALGGLALRVVPETTIGSSGDASGYVAYFSPSLSKIFLAYFTTNGLSFETVIETAHTYTVGDTLVTTLDGDTITIAAENAAGVVVAEMAYTDPYSATAATHHGLYTDDTTARFSAFSATDPDAETPTPYLIIEKVGDVRIAQELVYTATRPAA